MTTEIEERKQNTNKKSKSKIIITLLVVILLLIGVGFAFLYGKTTTEKRYTAELAESREQMGLKDQQYEEEIAALKKEIETMADINLDLIQKKVKDIGELSTVEYLYTDAGKFEDANKLFGVKVGITTKSFIAKWDGIIKAGIDIEKVSVDLDEENKKIVIHMPEAEILSHEIDEDSVETLDEKDGLFNPVRVQDVRNFDAFSKKAMEERAKENGILDKAWDNAKEIIEKAISTEELKKAGYSIEFRKK